MKKEIEEYNLDNLREIVRNLEEENEHLKKLLKENNISYENNRSIYNEEHNSVSYDEDQGSRIIKQEITRDLAINFFSMFWGRKDAYAKRGKNGGYYPQCKNRWLNICPKQNSNTKYSCNECKYKEYKELEIYDIIKHLKGEKEDSSDVIGVYPLLKDNTCRFIVFDFDDHKEESNENWKTDVTLFRKICKLNNVDHLVERSRSGKGAHLWIFFKKPIETSLARNFGMMLIEQGLKSFNLNDFKCFDRLIPLQDTSDNLGSLIALPLQGKALLNGNSAFIDEDFNAYYDQWETLFKTKKLTKDDVERLMCSWTDEKMINTSLLFNPNYASRPKPWKRNDKFNKADVIGNLHITLANGIYVDTLNLMPRIQNQIRCLAAFDNPEYYKKKRMGYSNYDTYSTVYLGKDINGYIRIPRGLKDKLIEKLEEANITYDIKDKSSRGRHINVSFNGDLRIRQNDAINDLTKYNNGILEAATAFGKTVVGSYLISKKKVSALILLNNISLQEQWYKELKKFLIIDEELPTYKTLKGERKRKDVIGFLNGSKNSLTGIIDIVSIQSLVNIEDEEIFEKYGMVLIDECQYGASNTYISVLNRIKAKYVYGVSATPQRSDHLEKTTYMMIGPIRHTYSSLQRAIDQGIKHYFVPRFTRVTNITNTDDINELYKLVCDNKERNKQIIFDIEECIKNNRTIMVLGRYKEHIKKIYEEVKDKADYVLLVYGDKTTKENKEELDKLDNIPDDKSVVIISTYQKLGEGFNYPCLDTLMLITPVSDPSKHEQYVGRLNRDYKGKEEVFVYDYVDSHVRTFAKSYHRRVNNYARLGYYIYNSEVKENIVENHIHSSDDYLEVFENDLLSSKELIVISSPNLSNNKIERFISILRPIQEKGIKVVVITKNPDNDNFNDPNISYMLIYELKRKGITVHIKDEVDESFSVIDNKIVWYGGISLLSKETLWNNLIRIEDEGLAEELLGCASLE